MDKAYIQQNQLIERYVQGKLVGEELSEFEIYVIEQPELVDEIEYAREMQKALDRSKHELFETEAPATGNATFWFGPQYAIAATMLLAITVILSGYLYNELAELRAATAAAQKPIAISGEVWLEPVRGNRSRVVPMEDGAALVVRIDVSAVRSESYSVEVRELDRDDAQPTSFEVAPDDERSVRFLISEYPAGRYLFSVTTGAGEPVAEHQVTLEQSRE